MFQLCSYRKVVSALLLSTGLLFVGSTVAQDQTKDQERDQDRTQLKDQDATRSQDRTQLKDQDRLRDRDREQIYGAELMTEEEITAHLERVRAAKTKRERQQIRTEHRRLMQERAREKNVTIIEPRTRRHVERVERQERTERQERIERPERVETPGQNRQGR